MDLIQAIIYGLVQGITEWLPISSTAHLRILPALLGWKDPGAAFTAVIQLGTAASVLVYYRSELSKAFVGWVRGFGGGPKDVDARTGWAIVWGTVPIVLAGVLLKSQIESPEMRSLYVIAATLILMGLVMVAAERFSRKERNLGSITTRDGWVVGLWQALALIPGMSRSGSTISGALFRNFDRAAAARFSFLLSVPSVIAAGLKEAYDARSSLLGVSLAPTLVATAVAFVAGYASIAFLIRFLRRHGLGAFAVYRIALGVALLVLIWLQVLSPMQGAR